MSNRVPVWADATPATPRTSSDATKSDRTVRILLTLPPLPSVDRRVLGVPLPVVRADLHRRGGELRLEPVLEAVLALPLGQVLGELRSELVEGQPRHVLAALEAGRAPRPPPRAPAAHRPTRQPSPPLRC